MNTVIIDVRPIEDSFADFARAWKTGEASAPRYSFSSTEQFWKTLTAKRWKLLHALMGAGPLGIRELARRLNRDVKAVHSDAQALVSCGLLDKADDGKVEFPYDAVHVDFMVGAA